VLRYIKSKKFIVAMALSNIALFVFAFVSNNMDLMLTSTLTFALCALAYVTSDFNKGS